MDKHPLGYQPSEPVYDPSGRDNVLMQSRHWWDKWGWRHRICAMETDYILNVLRHLEWRAFNYAALHAVGQSDADDEVTDETQQWLDELDPQAWITATPVYRALEAALEGPQVER